MIKEKPKKTKYNIKKSKTEILIEYIKTIGCSVLIAIFITTGLAIHARNEMIKNLYERPSEQHLIDRKIAEQIILQSPPLDTLQYKTYQVCMHTGEIYEAVEEYEKAQYAYELAVEKAKPQVYKPYYKLSKVLIAQEKFDKVEQLLDNINDINDKNLIKFKTRTYITMGDKYYSIGKFLSAAKSYEKAQFYYDKFSKKDKIIDQSIKKRIINSYINTADIMVNSGLNSDAIRFLKKAENYEPDNHEIRYKLAIVLSDLSPEDALKYLDPLLEEIPQDIDYNIYGTTLMKAANIADLDGRPTQAKYYRYRIHSIDLFVNRKVVYQNDLDISLNSFIVKKSFFTYPLKPTFNFINNSNTDIVNLSADFVLTQNGKNLETITKTIANKNKPLLFGTYEPNKISLTFNTKIFTKKEFETYTIKIYAYKDEKYKTLICEFRIPETSIYPPR